MIQAVMNTNFNAFVNTEANRIDTALVLSGTPQNIQYLCKFTNDMSGKVYYAYAYEPLTHPRFTQLPFYYNVSPNMYAGQIAFEAAGYYHYEVYEVTFQATPVVVGVGTAPATELDVILPANARAGVVQGMVAIGKLYVKEQAGSEEVQYQQNGGHVVTLDIAYGGLGYTLAPTVTIVGDCINAATATCTVSGGVVDTVTLVYAGNGYSTNPTVTLSNVGEAQTASIVASIQEHNYIYSG